MFLLISAQAAVAVTSTPAQNNDVMIIQAQPARPSKPRFQFRDLTVGANVPSDRERAGFSRCEKIKEFSTCIYSYQLRVGGVNAFGAAEYNNSGFYELHLSFPRTDGPTVKAALQAKYGEPCAVTSAEVQNTYGAKFPRDTTTWCFDDGMASYHSIGRNPDEADFRFLSKRELDKLTPSTPTVDF